VIVIDTSAIVAVFKGEADAERIALCIDDADLLLFSAASLLEASMVLSGMRSTLEAGDEWLDRLLAEQDVVIEPVTAAQAQLARMAFRMYGRGTGHGAALNFGDCFSYALAKSLDAPLLFKGDDFSRTDIRPALE
jgi:ribonuclease VapC